LPETTQPVLRRTARIIMAKPQKTDGTSEGAPDLLIHLEQTFGWSETQAADALGAYMMNTEAGQALRRELASCNRTERAA
jgi:hypothetical protein